MDGVHDMGGMDGFGPVEAEPDEPVFHAPWEGRVLAISRVMGRAGAWNLDASRFARERIPPGVYLTSSYYELWLEGLETNLVERGLVDADELAEGRSFHPGVPSRQGIGAEDIEAAFGRGNYQRPAERPALFGAGDRVRARNIHPRTHTRLPRYVRGHVGVVEAVHGCHVYPDVAAHGPDEDPQWLYTVRFSGRELWGDDADATVSVSVDAFEPYLEPA